MATLVLQAAGAFVGGVFGGPIGAMIGRAAGAVAGAMIDGVAVQHMSNARHFGPRLTAMPTMGASEGAPIARVYGRARVGGALIWTTRFEEVATTQRAQNMGGKGGGPKTTTYSYFGNFAVGVCEGPVAEIRRIWADGREVDRSKVTLRVYRGDEAQSPDPLIVAKEGAENAPAYRGLCYVVFERMPLDDYGARIPQMSFEVVRPVSGLGAMIRAVDIIPGSSEFAYAPQGRVRAGDGGASSSENRHVLWAPSDWTASIDALQALCPNLQSVGLVVAWFADDLRAQMCTVAPRVESRAKIVIGETWSVAGLSRAGAREVSKIDGRPAYGGTPSDSAVRQAIADLRERGLKVMLYPFLMMDIEAGNALPDPWSDAPAQPAYPWRGRIVCDPAPGRPSTVDATPAAAAQIAHFFGAASPAPDEWSYRRFILHYAHLAVDAGGVDAFLIGSELASLTRVRSAAGVYPAAGQLAQLALDVRAVLGPTTSISYAADWTEYGAHSLNGGAELRFPLDGLWASPAIDFIGLDVYWPLSDWRDGDAHADAQIARSIYDVDYLRARMCSGEAFDWYYADEGARAAQTRTPITDGGAGKPWVFRAKDLVNWWSQPHYERVDGVELAQPTGWSPRSKPIWLTETGCPAVDRGANAPNVFPDEKSSAARLPPFSRGFRDDLMQARALEAIIRHFDPAIAGHVAGSNPHSPVYGGPMVDPARLHVWAWDARPFPAFPTQANEWADAASWSTGHWLNGRLENAPVDALAQALLRDVVPFEGFVERARIDAVAEGYVVDRPMAPRAAIEPLASLFGFDAVASSGALRFVMRDQKAATVLGEDDFGARRDTGPVTLTRAQESELPREVTLTFVDPADVYPSASLSSRRVEGGARRALHQDLPIVLDPAEAQRRIDILLQDVWIGAETATFSLRPGLIALEVGDHVAFSVDGRLRRFQITSLGDGQQRDVEARAIDPAIFDHAPTPVARIAVAAPPVAGPPHVAILDLASARGQPTALNYVAASARPWPGALAVWSSGGGATFDLARTIARPATMGVTLTTVAPGPLWRVDRHATLDIRLYDGALTSRGEPASYDGRQTLAIRGADGAWEMLSFANATLIAPQTWRLSALVRGLGGEEHLAQRTLAPGADVVLLDDAVTPLTSDLASLGVDMRYRVGPADRDHGDDAYVEIVACATAKALAPLAPVRLRARRTPAGVVIDFVRRGRLDADAWEPVDIPLGEDREAYEIDILAGPLEDAHIKRTLTSATASALYPASAEIADFATPQATLDVRVCQISALVGRGFPARATLRVR